VLTIALALPTSLASPSKRKAVDYEEDFENIDPVIFSPKKAKGQDGIEIFKPSGPQFVLNTFKDFAKTSPAKPAVSRPMLQPRSPAPKINTATAPTLSAPAGRSPTRKRIGILNRRRTASPFTRIDPPKFNVGPVADAPFSIAAALSGTIPSYAKRQSLASHAPVLPRSLLDPEQKVGWFFEIHEDTVEETMTNLMEHSTCTLDISSDEETEARRRDERGKENVPPLDDISQTSTRLSSGSMSTDDFMEAKARARSSRRRKEVEEGAIEIDRSPLGDLAAEEFYAEGCSASSVVLVADDECEAEVEPEAEQIPYEPQAESMAEVEVESHFQAPACEFDFSLDQDPKGKGKAVEELMMKSDTEVPAQAALFEPLEKSDTDFEVWESASAKGDTDD
jgi:hypothetical protein